VSAFGFGGINYHVIIESGDAPSDAVTVAVPRGAELPLGLGIVAFGAESKGELLVEAQRIRGNLGDDPVALAKTCLMGPAPSSHPQRIAFFAEDVASAQKQLDAVIEVLSKDGSQARLEALGVAWRNGEQTFASGSVAFMFPGQGSQYVGMLDELRQRYAVVQDTLNEADGIMEGIVEQKLSSYISPPADKDPSDAFLDLLRTEVLQPAMLACDEALHRLLGRIVTPKVVFGHSLGEYGALIAAGVVDFADALRIVAARGDAMEEVPVDDKGLMLGVNTSWEKVEGLIAGVEGYVAVVNKNCPSQTILGGATAAVQSAQEKLQAAGLETMLLPVSHAFHSEIVAPASEPLRRALDRIDVRPPRVPLLSNVTGDYYPSADNEQTREWIRTTLARQVAAPVEFIAEVERAYQSGCRVFIEVGPKRAQAGFVKDILGTRPHRALHLAHPKVGEVNQLGRTVAALVADGVVPYGRPRVSRSIAPRAPYVGDAVASAHTVAAQQQLAALHEAAARPSAAPNAPAAVSGLLDQLAADPTFWQFVSLQGPAIVNALAASYQAARSLQQPGAFPMPATFPGGQVAGVASGFAGAVAPGPAGVAPVHTGAMPASPPVHAVASAPDAVGPVRHGGNGNGNGASTADGNGGADNEPNADEDLAGWVLHRVADITGYRVDELDIDAHLEAELGIDSIRQIEIILGLRDELELPADDGFRVSDYPNLRSLIGYLHERKGSPAPF
jgi:acyl transferase domain-containing protein/acyl carrier protein